MPKQMIKNYAPAFISAIILAAFAILGSSLVGFSYESTHEQILQNQRETLRRQINEVFPEAQHDNIVIDDVVSIKDDELGGDEVKVYRATLKQTPTGLIYSPVTADGYSGDILLTIAINENNQVTGVRVLQHKETPGLGDKIETRRSDWIKSFDGTSLTSPRSEKWAVKRDGGYFDQFTGATITPRAVVKAVKNTLQYHQLNKEKLHTMEPDS
jgi:electron transport complex protein RnfG